MDVKSLAKSKRAHSLHHSKKHPSHQSSKSPPVVSGEKKPTGKQAKEKPPEARESRRLPSNWDRYDDALSIASEEPQSSSSSAPPDIVAPKSKGADYAYLISEAKAQAQKTPISIPFADDITYDFGPMLVSHGQSILSWVEDDNFDFDGEASSSFQVPFLSLNLDALSKQLARAKPSDRWFIEELFDDELQPGVEDKHKAERQITAVKQDSGAPISVLNQTGINSSSQPSSDGSKSTKHIKEDVSYSKASDEMIPQMESIPSVKPFGFVAASAEAELDMLLNSFSETKILDSSGASSCTGVERVSPKLYETTKKRSIPSNTEADVDKLLHKTYSLSIKDPSALQVTSSSNSESKSLVLEDFDSWLDSI